MALLKNNKGFTMIELVLTLSILGLIIVFMSQILNVNIRLVQSEDRKVEYMQNARLAANYILGRIRQNNLADIEYREEEGQKLIKASGTVVFDATKRTVIPDNNPALWYYYEEDYYGVGNGYGELRNESDNALASYIRDISVQDMAGQDPSKKYLRITVTTGKHAEDETSLVLCVPLKSGSSTSIPYELVAEYLFNNSLLDTSGNSNHGSAVGNISWVMGPNDGNAASLDGSSYIEIKDSESLDSIASELRIDMWCYPRKFPNKSGALLIDKRDNNGVKGGYALELNEDRTLTLHVGKKEWTSFATLESGWNNISVTYKAGGQAVVTINGVSTAGNATDYNVPDSGEALRIGSNGHNKKYFFEGYLDDIRIYNRINP